MAISSSVILHFTQSKETLNKILEGNFKYSYSMETISFGDEEIKIEGTGDNYN